jgi:autotransporter-associated beta strand protein
MTGTGSFAGRLSDSLAGDGKLALVISSTSATTLAKSDSDYRGGTTLNGGTLYFAGDNVLGSGGLVATAGIISSNQGATLRTYAGAYGVAGNVTYGDSAYYSWNAVRTLDFSGATTLRSVNRTFTANTGVRFSAAGIDEDTAGLGFTKAGEGKMTLAGTNTYTGGTVVAYGTLATEGDNRLSSTAIIDVQNLSTYDPWDPHRNESYLFTTLQIGGAETLNSFVTAGKTKTNSGTIDLNGLSAVLTTGTTGGDTALIGRITGAGRIVKEGAGALTLTGATNHVYWYHDAGYGWRSANRDFQSTFTGGITLNGGTLQLAGNSGFGGATSVVTLNAGRLSSDSTGDRDFNNPIVFNADVPLGSLTNSGAMRNAGAVNLGGVNRTLRTDSDFGFSGVVSNGGLIKAGDAALTLTGANTYVGPTTLNAGRIRVGNNAGSGVSTAFSTSAVTLNAGRLSSSNPNANAYSLGNAVTLGGDVALGHATDYGPLTLSGAFNHDCAPRRSLGNSHPL